MDPQNTASRSRICEDASRNSGRQDNGIKPLTKKLGNEDEKSGEGFEPRQKKLGEMIRGRAKNKRNGATRKLGEMDCPIPPYIQSPAISLLLRCVNSPLASNIGKALLLDSVQHPSTISKLTPN